MTGRTARRAFALCVMWIMALPAFVYLHTPCDGAEESPEELRFGIFTKILSDVSQRDAEVAIQLWAKKIATETGFRASNKVLLYEDLSEVMRDARAGRVDLIGIPTTYYLKVKDEGLIEPVAAGTKGARIGDELVLVVKRRAGLNTLSSLAGKRIVMTGGMAGEIGRMWLEALLARNAFPVAQRFFFQVVDAQKSSQAVYAVFFGHADASVVTRVALETMQELNPQIAESLSVLASSPEYVQGIMCVRKGLAESTKKKVVDAVLSLRDSVTGKQILTLFRSDKVIPYRPEFGDNLEALIAEHQRAAARLARKR